MTIGLTIAENVATSIGGKTNTMWVIRSAEGAGNDGTDKQINIIFDIYESRVKFDAGDAPLGHFQNARRTLSLPIATESSQTTLHQELKVVLEGEGFTVTEETQV
jgi:hypothetical protein